MKKEKLTNKKRVRFWYEALPWLFMAIALPVCYFAWHLAQTYQVDAGRQQFHNRVNSASQRLTNEVDLYALGLYGVRSLFDSSQFVSEDEFKRFVSEMLNSNFSYGYRQVGFIKRNASTESATVTYVASKQPLAGDVFKVEIDDHANLKKILAASAKANQPYFSTHINLNQTHDGELAIVLPVYAEALHAQPQQQTGNKLGNKSRMIDGWVFANLDMHAIFNASLAEVSATDTSIRFAIYEKKSASPAQLLYENTVKPNNESIYSEATVVAFNGRSWTLLAQSLKPFEKKFDIGLASNVWNAGLIALFVTVALTSILFLFVGRLRTYDALKKVNQRLRLSDERWRFALEGSGDGIWDWDIENDHVEYSKRWKQIFGYGETELDGSASEWEGLLHPDDRQLAVDTLNAYLKGQTDSYSLECRLKCKDGSWKWILSRGMVVTSNPQGEATRMVGTHTDISQLKETEEQIWQHANYDYLTNLPNRRMLYACLEREIEQAKRADNHVALLFLDLDGFKEINDSIGHDQGDVLLQQAAKRLTECIYAQDVVSRLGGDEFIILISYIEDAALKNLELIAQKILTTLAAPFDLKHQKAYVTASIGIAIYPEDSTTIDGLIKNVDQAMYASKERGGNCFTYFTPEMQENALSRMHLSNDLRTALDNKELFIEYQPIVELASNKIDKAEALLRWRHADRGLISPEEFIPIAEDTRQINAIGNWVFIESIKQCKRWREMLGVQFQISVNKSPAQFMNADANHSEWFQLLSDKTEVKEVSIEITESLLLEPTGQVGSKLKEYRNQGIQISLDDFGTGYSSLSYLRKFEIDYLKIDKSFVANLAQSAEDRVLCRAIIVMAHSLGIKVIAEGIETEEQRDILLDAECDLGQGYYFAKPLIPAQFEAYVKKVQARNAAD